MIVNRFAYSLSVLATVVVLVWIGFFKFTPTEAQNIKPLVENHFAMSWMYKVMSVQIVSNVIGYFEIATAICLFFSLFWNKVGIVGGLAGVIIFLTTLSFLFTTPNHAPVVDGFHTVDFFILKDLAYLAICLMVFLNAFNRRVQE
jgi:uncharacterized membrane protein YkgB